jgi:hypothetical protein
VTADGLAESTQTLLLIISKLPGGTQHLLKAQGIVLLNGEMLGAEPRA